jgi:hypothetical protein
MPAGTETSPEKIAVEQYGCRPFLPAEERQVAARLQDMTGTVCRPYMFGCRRHNPAYDRDHHFSPMISIKWKAAGPAIHNKLLILSFEARSIVMHGKDTNSFIGIVSNTAYCTNT